MAYPGLIRTRSAVAGIVDATRLSVAAATFSRRNLASQRAIKHQGPGRKDRRHEREQRSGQPRTLLAGLSAAKNIYARRFKKNTYQK